MSTIILIENPNKIKLHYVDDDMIQFEYDSERYGLLDLKSSISLVKYNFDDKPIELNFYQKSDNHIDSFEDYISDLSNVANDFTKFVKRLCIHKLVFNSKFSAEWEITQLQIIKLVEESKHLIQKSQNLISDYLNSNRSHEIIDDLEIPDFMKEKKTSTNSWIGSIFSNSNKEWD